MSDQKVKVEITGGTAWIGLMLTLIAMNTCDIKHRLKDPNYPDTKQRIIEALPHGDSK